MIVTDASALLEMLLNTAVGQRVAERILVSTESLHAPCLVDLEIAQALRRFVHKRDLTEYRAQQCFADAAGLGIERHEHELLLPRIWALRESASAYDACYLALAEGLDASLVTCDAKLARSHGHRATIELIR